MKKVTCLVLASLWMLVSAAPAVQASAEAEDLDYVVVNCGNYAELDRSEYLTSDEYYCYDDFVDQLDDSGYGTTLMALTSLQADLDFTPNVDDYLEEIRNLIALQESENSASIDVQISLDNLKDKDSYIEDVIDLCMDSLSCYTGNYGNELQQQVMNIAEYAVQTTETTAEMLQAMSYMQSQIQSYVAYDNMLAALEKSSTWELREAAKLLRQDMDTLMQYNMGTAAELASEGVWKQEVSIFDCVSEEFYEWLDDWEVENALKSVERFADMKSAFDLGTKGALLAGNLILNTENMAKRIRELRALTEISDALAESVENLEAEYLMAYEGGWADRDLAEEYMDALRSLLNARRRGEYCLYSLITEDSGVLSHLFSGKEVENWYQKLTEFLNDKQWRIEMLAVDPEVLAIHFYHVFDGVAATWEEAAAYCESLGGHLVTIGSQAENDYVYSLMQEAGYRSAYIGLTDSGSEGIWRWVNGEPVLYTNWHKGEPSNSYNVGEHYALFYYEYHNSTWNDGYFNGPTVHAGTAFICEWDVDPDNYDTSQLLPHE